MFVANEALSNNFSIRLLINCAALVITSSLSGKIQNLFTIFSNYNIFNVPLSINSEESLAKVCVNVEKSLNV